jgi:hypothetical protein
MAQSKFTLYKYVNLSPCSPNFSRITFSRRRLV